MTIQPQAQGLFRGTLDGAPTQSVRFEIAMAGEDAYILAGLEDGWILDVGGVASDDVEHSIALTRADSHRFSGQLTAAITAAITTEGRRCRLSLPMISLAAEDGTTVTLAGELTWTAPVLEGEMPGELRLRSADRLLPPTTARLRPFNDGWLLTGTLTIAPGHVVSVHLTTAPPDLRILQARHAAGSVELLPVRGLSVRIVDRPAVTVVRFEAELDDGITGFSPLIGQFAAAHAAALELTS